MMIVVSNFRLRDLGEFVRAVCDIKGEGFGPELYFDVHPSNADAVDIAEPNWAAVALIYQAMLLGQDLVIEADLSPLLLMNLRHDFMALVRNYEPLARPIRIEAGASSAPCYRTADKDVATGLSFGVDSFATFLRYTRPEVPKGVRLTGAAVFQVGAFGKTSDPSIQMGRARTRCEEIVQPFGTRVYSLSSNMDDVFAPAAAAGPVGFAKTVGFRNAAAALVFQKRLGLYLASGNVDYTHATFGQFLTTESLDPAFQPLLNTEALQFQSGLAGTARYDKIAEIADHPLVHQHLDVCVGPTEKRFIGGAARNNCTECWKCILTALALDSMGKLDAFGAVFDLDLYRRERPRLMQSAVNAAFERGPQSATQSIVDRVRQAGFDLPQPNSRLVRVAGKWTRKVRTRARRALRATGLRT